MSIRRVSSIVLIAVIAYLAMMHWCSAQIVALGASATAGYGLPASDSFPAQLQAMLQAKGSSTRVINAGVSGETSAQILARVNSSVSDGTRIVILGMFTLNDSHHGVSLRDTAPMLRASGSNSLRVTSGSSTRPA